MNGPRPLKIAVVALAGFLFVVCVIAAVTKARIAGGHADREEERRPRSLGAQDDPTRPDWFRNMDRDTDGMLSRKEFVGTDGQFGKMDVDRDGVVSLAEARAADDWFRAAVPQ